MTQAKFQLEMQDPLQALRARQMQAKQLGARSLTDQRMAAAILVRNKVSPDRLQQAIATAHLKRTSLVQVMIDERLLKENDLPELQALAAGVLYVELGDYRVPASILGLLSSEAARSHQALPFRLDDLPPKDKDSMPQRVLWIALANPQNAAAKKMLEQLFSSRGYTVRFVAAEPSKVRQIIEDRYSGIFAPEQGGEEVQKSESMIQEEEESPARRLYEAIFREAMERGASDVHVESREEGGLSVRMRVDGVLQVLQEIPDRFRAQFMSYMKLKAGLDIAESRRSQSGRAEFTIGGRTTDVRAETLPTVYGETMVCRLISKEGLSFDLTAMGFSEYNLERFQEAFMQPYGSVLVTGPTGSGKSSTLYAALIKLNEESKKLVTIENPVEYRLAGVQQIAVDDKIGRGFPEALRSIMRADPDIIMVGEIRDEVTARTALEAANTGHMVLSTLHTNEAAAAPSRLLNMGVPDYLLADALTAVVAQRLLRRLCPHCKRRVQPEMRDIRRVGYSEEQALAIVAQADRLAFHQAHPDGCEACTRGYKGRVAVHEVLVLGEGERDAIFKHGGSITSVRSAALENGMRTLRDDALEKVFRGVTTLDEVTRVISTNH